MLYNLTGATIEVILADRTRARIPLTDLLESLGFVGAAQGEVPAKEHIVTSEQVKSLRDKYDISLNEAMGAIKKAGNDVAKADEALSAKLSSKTPQPGEAVDDKPPSESNKLLVTSDFVEAVAKANDGKQAASDAVATVAKALDEQAKAPVAKKVAAKTASKKGR